MSDPTRALATVRPASTTITVWTDEQKDLIKRTVCKGASDDELAMFMYVSNRTGLDPFLRQIHSVPRKEKNDDDKWVEVRSIQVGIDGLRLVADRSGNYAPGREPEFAYNPEGQLEKATAYVRKLTKDGTWHEVAATAHYVEYVQKRGIWEGSGSNRKKVGEEPNRMWTEKEHIMLAKCAEALALRKAFPAETSGLYIHEEMQHLDQSPMAAGPTIETPRATGTAPIEIEATPGTVIAENDRRRLFAECSKNGKTHTDLKEYLGRDHGIESTKDITPEVYPAVLAWAQAPKA